MILRESIVFSAIRRNSRVSDYLIRFNVWSCNRLRRINRRGEKHVERKVERNTRGHSGFTDSGHAEIFLERLRGR